MEIVSRGDVQLYRDDLDRFYRCLTKVAYMSVLTATRQSYSLSENRDREYEPYVCSYCGDYHIGRMNRVRRPD